jgi:hypothetical protein
VRAIFWFVLALPVAGCASNGESHNLPPAAASPAAIVAPAATPAAQPSPAAAPPAEARPPANPGAPGSALPGSDAEPGQGARPIRPRAASAAAQAKAPLAAAMMLNAFDACARSGRNCKLVCVSHEAHLTTCSVTVTNAARSHSAR